MVGMQAIMQMELLFIAVQKTFIIGIMSIPELAEFAVSTLSVR